MKKKKSKRELEKEMIEEIYKNDEVVEVKEENNEKQEEVKEIEDSEIIYGELEG